MPVLAGRTACLALVALGLAIGCSAPAPKNDLAPFDAKEGQSKKKKATDTSPEGAPILGEEPKSDDGEGREADTTPAPEAPNTCTKDAECGGPGRICENSTCIKGCRTTSQCGDGKVCESGACVTTSTTAVECTTDEHCELGTICLTQKCIAGCYSTYDCPVGQSCYSGQCKPTVVQPSGTECTSDGQCNPGNNGSGQICSAQGTCVPGCRQDYHCPGVKICVTGQCR